MTTQEVMKQLDQIYAEGDRVQIEQFIRSRLEEARSAGDWGTALMLLNEGIGLYRVLGRFEEGMKLYYDALRLIEQIGQLDSLAHAGTMLNGATLCRAAGKKERAGAIYARVYEIYKRYLPVKDYRMAGLCNNRALLMMECGDPESAVSMLLEALDIISGLEDTKIEQATNHVNLAHAYMDMWKMDDADLHLAEAEELFAEFDGQDPHFASCLSARGRFWVMEDNLSLAANLYERSLKVIEKYHGRSANYVTTKKMLDQVLHQIEIEAENI